MNGSVYCYKCYILNKCCSFLSFYSSIILKKVSKVSNIDNKSALQKIYFKEYSNFWSNKCSRDDHKWLLAKILNSNVSKRLTYILYIYINSHYPYILHVPCPWGISLSLKVNMIFDILRSFLILTQSRGCVGYNHSFIHSIYLPCWLHQISMFGQLFQLFPKEK